MTDTTFKTAQTEETPQEVSKPVKQDLKRVMVTEVEAPFTEYKTDHKLPFTADYFEAKLTWDEKEMVDDVNSIESYLTKLVYDGKLENTSKSAREKLKSIEKMAGIDKLESRSQRLIKLSEFVKYLQNLEKRTDDRF